MNPVPDPTVAPTLGHVGGAPSEPPPPGETGRELSPAEAGAAMQTEINRLTALAGESVVVPPPDGTPEEVAAQIAALMGAQPATNAPLDSEISQPSTQPAAAPLERDALPTHEAALAEAADRVDEGIPSAAAALPTDAADPSAADVAPGSDTAAAADLTPPVSDVFAPPSPPVPQSRGPRAGPASHSHGKPVHKFET
jgi:hypothetical protein